MRNILTQFLVSSSILAATANMTLREAEAKEIFHWLSLVYCAGNACLALYTDSRAGFYTGLFLISLGSGGIKPCVSSFVGEPFDQTNKHLAKLVFVATFSFWIGRGRYIVEPPTPADPHSFGRVCWTALRAGRLGMSVFFVGTLAALAWLHIDDARQRHPEEDVGGARAVLRVLILFALVTPFWSLFDQKASTWVLQGTRMQLPGWSWFKSASQMQSLNPALVMVLIPFNNLVLFPLMRRMGI